MFRTKKVKAPASLGQLLSKARKKSGKTLAEFEETTCIRQKFLQALENDRFNLLPAKIYALGFCQKYALALNLNAEKATELFNEQFSEWQKGKENLILTPVAISPLTITPKTLVSFGLGLAIFAIIFYIYGQIQHITAPPKLVIISPQATAVSNEPAIEIQGQTDIGSILAINNQPVDQDSQGNFRQTINLQEGMNAVEITATNRFQKSTKKNLKILKTNS